MDFETGQGYGSAEWHPAVVVCEVEVDTETGQVKVLRLHAELYAGKVINPLLSELQVQGATTFGLGQVLFEELVVDTNGSITNPNLSDYMKQIIKLTVNGIEEEKAVHTHHSLLEVLRDEFKLFGAREGCGIGMNWLVQLLDHRFTSWVN